MSPWSILRQHSWIVQLSHNNDNNDDTAANNRVCVCKQLFTDTGSNDWKVERCLSQVHEEQDDWISATGFDTFGIVNGDNGTRPNK